MSASEDGAPFLLRIPHVLLVAGVTAAGYWIAHRYEAAYLAHFGLPPSIARVSVNATIVAAGTLGGAVWAAILFWAFTRREELENDAFVQITHVFLSMSSIVFFVHLWLFGVFAWREWVFLFVLVMLSEAVLWFARRAAVRRQERGLPPRVFREPFLHRALAPWIGREVVFSIGLVALGLALAGSAGRARAIQEQEFLTLSDPDGFVVIRVYEDLFVAARLNRKTHVVGPEYMMISTSRPDAVPVRREKLGRLRAAPLTETPTDAKKSPSS